VFRTAQPRGAACGILCRQVCNPEQTDLPIAATLDPTLPHRAALRRLLLKLERDLLTRTHFRALLADVDATIFNRRRELRNLKAQMTSRRK
jgi:hypothetical protein